MSEIEIKADLDTLYENNSTIPFEIEFSNPKHHGLSAKLRIRHIVNVRDRSPENVDRVVYEQQFMVAGRMCKIDVHSDKILAWGYNGFKIGITCQVEVIVDDAIFFDSKERVNIPLMRLSPDNNGLAANPGEELDPDDTINFIRNFAIISLKQKIAWIAAFGAFILAAIGNFLLALFDTFIASVPFVYSGEPEFILFGTGAGAVAGGVGFLAVHIRILRSYKTAKLVETLPIISKGRSYRFSDFFNARSTVKLKRVTLRLVVANLECGQYWRGSGTDRRCVSFTHPSRAVVLFEKTVAEIPKGVGIEAYFNERLNLDKTFECMLPNYMITSTHGVKLKTVIQIMVADLADTSLELPLYIWNSKDFTDNHDHEDDD